MSAALSIDKSLKSKKWEKDLIKMKNYIPFGKPIVSNKEINLVNKVIKVENMFMEKCEELKHILKDLLNQNTQ